MSNSASNVSEIRSRQTKLRFKTKTREEILEEYIELNLRFHQLRRRYNRLQVLFSKAQDKVVRLCNLFESANSGGES